MNKQIIDNIKKQLTGQKESDVVYLQTELEIYRAMHNDEVITAITSMLFNYLDPTVKEKLDLKTHAILDDRRLKYEQVVGLISNNQLDEAKEILLNLLETYEKAEYITKEHYYDFDQMIEYFLFCENVTKAKSLKIKRLPEPVTYYLYQLSEIVSKQNQKDKEILYLEQALVYNPCCQYVLERLAMLYLEQGQRDLAYQTIIKSLKYAYTKEQLSFAYELLGDYYQENKLLADALYLSSKLYKPSKHLDEKIKGDKLKNLREINEVLQNNNIQIGPSLLVIKAIDDFIIYSKHLHDKETLVYLLMIAFELTDDKKYLEEYEKILNEDK